MSSLKLDTVEFEDQSLRGHARKLGPIEGFFAMDQRQQLYSNFAIIAQFNTDIKTNRSLLARTLRAMVIKYPILGCTIHNFGNHNNVDEYVKVVSRIVLDDVIIEMPKEIMVLSSIDEKFRRINQMTIRHEACKTPWRIGFLDDNTLVYVSNHCLSDGSSGKYFIEDFHCFYNEASRNPGVRLKDEVILEYQRDYEKLPMLPPPIESIIDYEPSLYNTIRAICGLVTLEFLAYKCQVKCSKSDTHTYRSFNIAPLELAKLLAALKSKPDSKVTLTPYIHAAWLSTLHEHRLTSQFFNLTGVLVPCNTRQYLPNSEDLDQFRYGSCVSSSNMPYYTSNKFSWDTLTRYHEHYKETFLNRDFLYQTFGLLKVGWLSRLLGMDNEEFFTNGVVGKSRGQSCISNIVAVKNHTKKDDHKLKVKNVWFAQHACATPHSFSIGVVSSEEGGLNMTIAMVDGTVSLSKFDNIVETFHDLLLSYDDLE